MTGSLQLGWNIFRRMRIGDLDWFSTCFLGPPFLDLVPEVGGQNEVLLLWEEFPSGWLGFQPGFGTWEWGVILFEEEFLFPKGVLSPSWFHAGLFSHVGRL